MGPPNNKKPVKLIYSKNNCSCGNLERVTVSVHGKKKSSEDLLDEETSEIQRLQALLTEGKPIKHKLRMKQTLKNGMSKWCTLSRET